MCCYVAHSVTSLARSVHVLGDGDFWRVASGGKRKRITDRGNRHMQSLQRATPSEPETHDDVVRERDALRIENTKLRAALRAARAALEVD